MMLIPTFEQNCKIMKIKNQQSYYYKGNAKERPKYYVGMWWKVIN